MKEQFDAEEIYCRKLGHHLHFKYCRGEYNGLPCKKVFDCWFERLDITEFIDAHYDAAEVGYFSALPQNRMVSLVDLIQAAQQRVKKETA